MTDRAGSTEAPVVAEALDFRSVFAREFSYVWNTLRRLGVGTMDLKDQSQEVFLTVHSLLPDYDPSRPMKPWLFAIAYRIAARYREARAKHPVVAEPVDLADDVPGADVKLEAKEKQAIVLEAIQSIELRRRAIFILAEIDEVPVPQIAETLGIPLNTAYSRLRVAREEFAETVRRLRLRGGRS